MVMSCNVLLSLYHFLFKGFSRSKQMRFDVNFLWSSIQHSMSAKIKSSATFDVSFRVNTWWRWLGKFIMVCSYSFFIIRQSLKSWCLISFLRTDFLILMSDLFLENWFLEVNFWSMTLPNNYCIVNNNSLHQNNKTWLNRLLCCDLLGKGLIVQWLSIPVCHAGDPGSIPGQPVLS